MQNAPLPREVLMPSTSWRDRRRRRRYPVVTSATLKPVAQHAFEAELEEWEALSEQLVVVHDVSLDGLGLLGFESAIRRDYPVMFGTLYIFTLFGLVLQIVGDLLPHPRLNPAEGFNEAVLGTGFAFQFLLLCGSRSSNTIAK